LQLAFETKPLRTICESERHAKHEFGDAVAEILKHRLADMCAATSVNDLVAGQPRALAGAAPQQMVVDLNDSYRIVFTANHTKNPVTETGNLDWKRVSRIKILRIERDHG
jgi:plasmid maintenance system killer protein